ncbi:AzlD domain-containing protein [Paraburkholderia xenovorans]|uniref:AzlD domain-containing protein n=1 Tax=Paraburkholderia xenovorans TaxID=36873 RepID=UPI0015599131|nr:AzlD domain-containing protein [Paraburkholderia xenovorans]NPT34043.1 AzlD domain-containing protein [Paraburkholderia xenovorans]
MSWWLILTLAAVVFFNRYVFLEPKVPVKLPRLLSNALEYSAPCLLTAICAPIILMDKGLLRSFPGNPYFLGAAFSVVFALVIRSVVLSVVMSLAVFYLLVRFL